MSRKLQEVLSPGQVVKELRIKKGWTQQTLSEVTGMAVANLSNIERGFSNLGDERAILLAEAFGVKPETILFPPGYERKELKSKIKAIRDKLKKISTKK